MASGALTLWLLVQLIRRNATGRGSWPSALELFVYAAAAPVLVERRSAGPAS